MATASHNFRPSAVRQDLKERPAPRDQKAQRVRKDHRDHKGLRVILAPQVLKAHKEPLVHRDPKAPTVRLVRRDRQDRKDPRDQRDRLCVSSMRPTPISDL